MLDPEIVLQPFQRSQAVFVEPNYLEIGKTLKIDQNSSLFVTQVHLGGFLGILVVFDGDGVPRVGLYLLLDRLVLGEQQTHSLVHQLYNINFYLKCNQSAGGGFSSSAFLFYSSSSLFFSSSPAFHLSSACLKARNFTLFVMGILFILFSFRFALIVSKR